MPDYRKSSSGVSGKLTSSGQGAGGRQACFVLHPKAAARRLGPELGLVSRL